MSGSINGVGAQQVPIANTFKPGQSSGSSDASQNNVQDNANARQGADIGAADVNNVQNASKASAPQASQSQSASASGQERGSLLDIVV